MPKSSGPHRSEQLTDRAIRALKTPGRYPDGRGLYLVVRNPVSRQWLLRVTINGRRRDMGLGGYPDVSLAEARRQAGEARAVIAQGRDPISERRRLSGVLDVRKAAEEVHASLAPSWRSPKHEQQWMRTLEDYVFPRIAARRVDQVTTSDLVSVLQPIWLDKPETARRVKQRLRAIFRWCAAMGHLNGPSPVDGLDMALPRQRKAVNRHAAMPIDDAPVFFRSLYERGDAPPAELALSLLILTAARTGEVLGAQWPEFDLVQGVWTVPADRMKTGVEHRVPLSKPALNILKRAEAIRMDDFVFPGQRAESGLSNMAMLGLLKRRGLSVSAHGFRSTFRDWAAERTAFPAAVCEMALAHTIPNKTEAAYRRGDLFAKRRELMTAWSDFLLQQNDSMESEVRNLP